MAFDEKLAERIRVQLGKRRGLTEKKMFGGIGFMLNGNMCVGIHGHELIVRLAPEATETALKQRHTRIFDLSGGRPMKGWILVQPAGLGGPEALAEWIDIAVKYASSLPAKK
jgi:TfoX-like protein